METVGQDGMGFNILSHWTPSKVHLMSAMVQIGEVVFAFTTPLVGPTRPPVGNHREYWA